MQRCPAGAGRPLSLTMRAMCLAAIVAAVLTLCQAGPPGGPEARAATTAAIGHAVADETLLRDPANGTVYLVYASVKHAVANAATLAALGLSAAAAITPTAADLQALPLGAPLSVRLIQGQPWPWALIASGGPVLYADPPAASAGAIVQLSGSHFGASEAVQIRYSNGEGTLNVLTDAQGSFAASIALPPDEALETMRISAFGVHSSSFAVEPFTVIPIAPAPTLTVMPPVVSPGQTLRLSGSGFAPGEQISLFYGSSSAVATTAGSAGTFRNAPLAVPAGAPAGAATAVAYGKASHRTAAVALHVVPAGNVGAALIVNAPIASAGSLVLVSGSGFVAGDRIAVKLDNKTQVTAQANAAGAFTDAGFTMPPAATPGDHVVSALGSPSGRRATMPLTVVALSPQLSLSASSATPGTRLIVDGAGYAPGEQVTLSLNGVALETSPLTVTTDPSGAFEVATVVPSSALSGPNSLTAIGSRSRASAGATLQVTLPVASTWYFPGADTLKGDDPYLALLNTQDEPAAVTIVAMFGDATPITTTTTVLPHSRATVDLASVVGAGRQFYVQVSADRPIGAGLTQLRPGRDFATMLGASTTHQTWYLAEGYTGQSFKETFFVFNPGERAARLHVQLLPVNGRAGLSVDLVAQPRSGLSIPINSYLPNQSLGALVTADQGVVVARAQEFGPGGYGLTQRVGTNLPSATWLFAEGSTVSNFETYLTVLNPNPTSPATVTASFFDATGTPIGDRTLIVRPLHRGTIKVNDVVRASSIATILTSNVPVVAERPLYFGPPNASMVGGSDVFGRNGGDTRWLFPEGTTGAGSTQFLLLQNPGEATALVEATFYMPNGRTVTTHYTIAAKSRVTVNVTRDVPGLAAGPNGVALRATNGVPFVAEESLYAAGFAQGDSTEGIAQ